MSAQLDHTFGSPLLPTDLRRVRATDRGVLLDLDTETHDRGLLRSIADAARVDEEFVPNLVRYAEIQNAIDTNERTTNDARERACLEDEAEDLIHELDRAMGWQPVGEGLSARVNRTDTETLAGALVGVVARNITDQAKAETREEVAA